jgi:hypothetical protein
MKLSANFSLREFTRSQFATRHGIDNTPNKQHVDNLRLLAIYVLQPIRDALGQLDVSSGFRCERLNTAVGGSASSQHRLGEASDIEPADEEVSNLQLAHWIVENVKDFDQCILEYYDPSKGLHSGWVHVSYRKGNNRREVLTKLSGVPGYSKGLPPAPEP